MRGLKTEDCFYVAGGDDGDGRDGGGHDGYAGDSGGWGECSNSAASSDKNYCIDKCSREALPSGDFGMRFARCMNACFNPFAGLSEFFSGWSSVDNSTH